MSFTTCSTFSTNSWSLVSVQAPSYSTLLFSSVASIYAGARGSGSPISVSCSPSFRGSMGSGSLATRMARGLAGMGGIQNKKEAKQRLNNRLAFYLDRVRSLETKNGKTIEDLRAQIFTNTVDNARIILLIDSAHLAADDSRVKYETEPAMRQFVESDIQGLRKVITNVTQLQLETEIESLKEELPFIRTSERPTSPDFQLWVNCGGRCPKSQDLAKIMADIRAQYDQLARKN
ncbi:Keratin, type I cytoskeletal 18 [Saguinus oedipus]|uniref:Keratin, type I cytoskeletal 18 n=1 Tax=Saguinus oedipus TaxID=9490 RepID=A0ABQ9UE38_SAGOE|nr:Keratin, type I cytoskeletal 18 [Saguinus oedipus]